MTNYASVKTGNARNIGFPIAHTCLTKLPPYSTDHYDDAPPPYEKVDVQDEGAHNNCHTPLSTDNGSL